MSHAVLKLQDAGFDRNQVEAITDYIDNGSATKVDIAEVKAEIDATKAELKGDIADVKAEIDATKAELKGDIADVKSELKGDIAALKVELKIDIAETKGEMKLHRWMLGIIIAAEAFPYIKDFFAIP